ncbi:protein phosphatase regulator [Ophidiomyces ophidiicola]|uniref:protein phosphatase regulator n=1 Tax=Ophidiomyces ophidiicola TaxID=1387563 RepID=UPI0020C5AB7E|nr:protein phosphatase regulator [Ophidiomyces ophidiicola]KAI1917124.1 protein phosphatase regulator [Ophidiomyces ophidiicola]KAI1929756.1 protein phosphatase regulator [Ophidiomyces ophidiicola]KAI1946442.1 protein phosphatase regulator [Ophidiomyces ophidiicola]KAI1960510.1 protein phosphatase regulator [Ophidiomyces ophidiicola]KAI1966127.1 protein phosphatase regulator [Ophidiomyces ophidiicola]
MAAVLAPAYRPLRRDAPNHHPAALAPPRARSQPPGPRAMPASNTVSYCPAQHSWVLHAPDDPPPRPPPAAYMPASAPLLDPLLFDTLADELHLPEFEVGPASPSDCDPPSLAVSEAQLDDWLFQILRMPRTAGDDACLEQRPRRHVDYLSHRWEQEQLWQTWRYAVGKQDSLPDGHRLANAAWRAWSKIEYGLATLSPESLGWVKEADVTWLYGPLYDDSESSLSDLPFLAPSASNSFPVKKPILKRTTISQAILQHSLSTNSLLEHASNLIKSRSADHPDVDWLQRSASDSVFSGPRAEIALRAAEATLSTPASGATSPTGRRRITFNNVVSQVVAVGGDDDDDHEPCYRDYDDNFAFADECCLLDDGRDSDDEMSDGTLVMAPQGHSRPDSRDSTSSTSSFNSDTRTIIAHLPPTTLKYDSDSDVDDEPYGRYGPACYASAFQQVNAANDIIHQANENPSSSQPSLLTRTPKTSSSPVKDSSSNGDNDEMWYLSPSGVFVPPDQLADRNSDRGDSGSPEDSLIGRVVDAMHTVRDIAHVFWNVGWGS